VVSRIAIPADAKWLIRQQLELLGIHRGSLFPDLADQAQWIKEISRRTYIGTTTHLRPIQPASSGAAGHVVPIPETGESAGDRSNRDLRRSLRRRRREFRLQDEPAE
jgi:hypothetical protein